MVHFTDLGPVLDGCLSRHAFEKPVEVGGVRKTELEGDWSSGISAQPSDRKLEFPLDLNVINF